MNRIFLSYSSKDTKFAHELTHNLKMYGIDTWIDQKEILWGSNLIEETQKALKNSDAIIVLISENTKNSQWSAFEIGAATALGKKIIPILLTDDIKFIPSILSHFQVLNAAKIPMKQIIKKIENSLKE